MLAVVVGAFAFAARYVTTGAIENDHFVTFTRGLQILHGDWPVRDFDDPGFPLSYLLSTLAAAIFGPSLFVNVLLCTLLLALTSAMTFLLAFRATGSVAAGLVAAALTMAVYPRLYNATKVIVPVVAIWLAWRYADAPSRGRMIALAVWSAAAFLFRHDYLVDVAAADVVVLVTCHVHEPRAMAARLSAYALLTLFFIAPWLIYVQLFEGVPEYFASALRFVAAEGRRTTSGLSSMFCVLIAVPIAGLIGSVGRGGWLGRSHLASASVMLLTLDVVFLRDVLEARLPDVMAATAVVGAATAGRYLSQRAIRILAATGAVVIVLVVALQISRRSEPVPGPLEATGRIGLISGRLRALSTDIIPNPSMAPLIAYLSMCTRPDERVLVAGFGPEIPALSHRPFAARLPSWLPGYYEDVSDVHRALTSLRGERLGAAIFLDGTAAVSRSWPAIFEAIRDRGFDEYPVGAINPRIRVWLPRAASGARRDSATDLPCLSL